MLMLSACGEEGGDETTSEGGDSPSGQADIPTPKEPVTAEDCEGQTQLSHSFLGDQKPGPPTKEDCGFAQQVAKDLRKVVPFDKSESREFGTAAVTDVTKDGDPFAILWLLDTDGRYKFLTFAPLGEPELSGEETLYTLIFATEPTDAPSEEHEDFALFDYVPAQKAPAE
jgi:hypothetical protein